jgi:hypothetical protein
MQVKANIGSHARGEIALFLIGIVYVLEKATTKGAWQGKLFSERLLMPAKRYSLAKASC